MPHRRRRWYAPFALAATLAAGLLATAVPALADPVVDPGPVGPNQFFTGVVNGQRVESRIAVNCTEPTGFVPTGHPVAGQTVSATRIPPPPGPVLPPYIGATGSTARALEVEVGASPTTTPPLVLRFYDTVAQIPTTAVVPCTGTGAVTFGPIPAGSNARAATIRVVFFAVP